MNAKLKEKELDEKEYEKMLDEVYGEIEIGNLTFSAGRIIRKLDKTAFDCGMADYADSLPDVWICGECESKFDDEKKAEECCKD